MIHIGLFEGIGGFSLAARWAGWKSVYACEIDSFCQKVLKKNFPSMVIHDDINTLTYESINSQLSGQYGTHWRNDDIIITGGFPCQPFSTAGKRNGTNDDRYLWPEMLRVIREVKPTWVVGENVAGLLSMDGGAVFEEVCTSLEDEGYAVRAFVLPAISVGAPHRRDRVWIVAHSERCDARGTSRQLQTEDGGKRLQQGEPMDEPCCASEVHGRAQGCQRPCCNSECAGLERNTRIRGAEEFTEGHSIIGHPNKPRLEGYREYGECANERAPGSPDWARHWYETAIELCRMDDGLPEELDLIDRRIIYQSVGYFGAKEVERRLGIDCSQVENFIHRSKRLKALGNAIVPQVAYEIFQAINKQNLWLNLK